MTRTSWAVVAVVLTAALLWIVTGWPTRNQGSHRSDEADDALAPPAAAEPAAPTERAPAASIAQPGVAPSAPAAPTAPAAPAAPADPEPEPQVADLPAPEQTGPVDELKALFASEPRDSAAGSFEKQIEAAFRGSEIPPGLLKSVLCHNTVCRVETRWNPESAIGFMAAFTRLMMAPDGRPAGLFDSGLAVSPEGEPDAHGTRAVDVYLKRIVPEPGEPTAR
jgi:hypothetical protein